MVETETAGTTETACCSYVHQHSGSNGQVGTCTAFKAAAASLIDVSRSSLAANSKATLCSRRGGQTMPHFLLVIVDDAGMK